MSDLSCDRLGCPNVMCDRHSRRYGHICDECFEELTSIRPRKNIEIFMGSNKYSRKSRKVDPSRKLFECEFKTYKERTGVLPGIKYCGKHE